MKEACSAESSALNFIRRTDPETAAIIEEELARQQNHLVLIASENLASRAVLQAQGSVLTNKYAEGYPGARYYGGCGCADKVEGLARERARKLFGADHANVQPHAGAPANLAVFLAVLEPGDRILGMDRSHGGHLTHGSPVNVSGRYYEAFSYGVDPNSHLIDLEAVRAQALRVRPKLIIAGASSYPRRIDFGAFARLARECGAFLLVDMAHVAGLVAAGLHPSPFPAADFVTTTTHKTLRGPRGGMILCRGEHAQRVDRAVFPGLQGGPLVHVIAAKAVALQEALEPEFAAYQRAVVDNAAAMAEALLERGFNLVTGGTDTHLLLIDLRAREITGLEAERVLDRIGITANKNAIPFDPRGPQVTSGLRLGTPVITSRGMGTEQAREIAALIDEALRHRDSAAHLARLRRRAGELCRQFPVYNV